MKISTAAAAAIGAAAALLLDPSNGRRRRRVAADRLGAIARQSRRRASMFSRRAASEAYGITQQATHRGIEHPEPSSETMLADRVRSQVFRMPEVPKESLVINVERDNVVVLRGEVGSDDQISSVEAAVRSVPGVRDVENLLHLAGTPAPMR